MQTEVVYEKRTKLDFLNSYIEDFRRKNNSLILINSV